jgi:hypothetical protein
MPESTILFDVYGNQVAAMQEATLAAILEATGLRQV